MAIGRNELLALLQAQLDEAMKSWRARFPTVGIHVRPGWNAKDRVEREQARTHIFNLEARIADLQAKAEAPPPQSERKPHPSEKVWPWSPNYQPTAPVVEASPDAMVWAIAPDGGRYVGIKRRKCKLHEVPTGWQWEPCEED